MCDPAHANMALALLAIGEVALILAVVSLHVCLRRIMNAAAARDPMLAILDDFPRGDA